MSLESPSEAGVDPQTVRRKVAWRIVPLLFVLYGVSYMDRANLGNAKLQMQNLLPWFTPEVFGYGAGIFFIGYQLLEIPGALLVERWSARKWFARILISWGLCSMGMALAATWWQFYLARFLLGLAEAGFFPGVVVYLTHWFPRADRARALAGMVLAIPISLTLGAWASAALLSVHWFGAAGWQWLFLVEGAPAVLLGVIVPFVLVDRPAHAKWLTPGEQAWLEGTLAEERRQAAATGGVTLRAALRRPTVWLLALGIFAANTGGYALVFWLPTVVQGLLTQGSAAPPPSEQAVLGWTSVVYACGLAGVWLSGQSSDRTGERKWHCFAGMLGTGVFLAGSALPGQPWALVFIWLCLAGFFSISWPPPFWVLPTLTLSESVAAVSIGFINMSANCAGALGSPVVGLMQQAHLDSRLCLLFLAGCYVVGAGIIAVLRVPRSLSAMQKPPARSA
ncbi:MAG TPA: MFS transporter, partial [Gemmataceae bacterium]|nr:MFS transporter [Gemmataceae bacterium]